MSSWPGLVLRNRKMRATMSAWTPLNHRLSNDNLFEERRALLRKWFDKWTDSQRKVMLQDFFSRCSQPQLRFLRRELSARVTEDALDFTAVLPRVLSLYIFSFLDPRSLCRCAQVSWHWRSLVELDQLWMPKCLRLGWCISFAPTPFEQGVWKRHYIETVRELRITMPQVTDLKGEEPLTVQSRRVQSIQSTRREGGGDVPAQRKEPPPWRDSDRHPTDTLRFNYLENVDPVEQARLVRMKAQKHNAPTKAENTRTVVVSDSSYKLRKARSLLFMSLDLKQSRPEWAASTSTECPVTKETAEKLSQTAQWNAGIRPAPARQSVPRMSEGGLKAYLRSQRSSPAVPLFEG